MSTDYAYVRGTYGADVWTTCVSRAAYERALAAGMLWYDNGHPVFNIHHKLENYGFSEFFNNWTRFSGP